MKFTKELPKLSDYYWFIDISYPVPIIGFMGPIGKFYDQLMREVPRESIHNLRFGDRILTPKITEIDGEIYK